MADTSVGRVTVALGLDTTGLKQGADRATKTVENLGRDLTQVGKSGSDDFAKIERALKELGTALGSINRSITQGFDKSTQAIDKASRSIDTMKRKTQEVDQSVKKAGNSLSDMADKATRLGTKMSLAVTAPMVATGVAAVRTANQFEFSMASITGLVGVAADEVKAMEGDVRSMAVEFGRSAPEAAEALYFVTSAGITGADAMSVLESSLKAASVGLGETMVIADTVSSALNAYGIENLSAAQATDLMVAAVREGKMEADQLAGALPRVLPIASAMSVSFEEVGAAFAAMSRNGTDANEAATQIRGILSSLLNPTKQAEEQLNALGLSGAGLRQTIREDGLLTGLKLLTDAFGNNEEAAGVVFGNIRALTGVMSLFGAATQSTETIFGNLVDNTGDLDKAFTAMSDTGTFKANQAMAALKDAMISLGQVLVPIVLPIFKAITSAISAAAGAISGLPGPIKTVVVVFGGLLAAAGPLLIAFGALAKAWLALKAAMATEAVAKATAQLIAMGPVALAIAGSIALIGGAWYTFNKNANEARERQERLTEALRNAGDPTVTLTDKTRELVDEYVRLQGEQAGATSEVEAMAGAQAFVQSELGGLITEFAKYGIGVAELTEMTQTGTDAFDDLSRQIDQFGGNKATTDSVAIANMENLIAKTEGLDAATREMLLTVAQSGDVNITTLGRMVSALDETSDAFDDNREAVNKSNQELLSNIDTIAYFSDALGADAFQALMNNALATAETVGRTDEHTYALEQLTAAVSRVTAEENRQLFRQSEIQTSLDAVTGAVDTTVDAYARLRSALADTTSEGEKQAANALTIASSLNVLSEALDNNLSIAYMNAMDKSAGLRDSMGDLEGSSVGVERAVREQMMAMLQVIADTKNMKGSVEDLIPVLAVMYNDLLDGADAAGIEQQAILDLVDSIGILDGLDPEVKLAITMNTEQLAAQIATIRSAISELMGDASGRRSPMLAGLREQLATLETISKAISSRSARSSGGRGGGGGGGGSQQSSSANDFNWIEGWVGSIADLANDLISTDFAQALVDGSSDDIAKAFNTILDNAMTLKIADLPAFKALLTQLRTQFASLGTLAGSRDALTEQIETATDRLVDLREVLNDVRSEADAFSVSSGLTSPTLTMLDQARQAQDKYDELYARAGQLKADRASFLAGVEGAVNQPLTGRNPLGQTRKLLTQATQFRDNLIALRDRGFGPDVIRQVAEAGLIDGNSIAKGLLSLSGTEMAEFTSMRQQIASLATEAGGVAVDVLFSADISQAEAALDTQRSIVTQLFDSAISEAQTNLTQQQTIVDGLNTQLSATETAIRDLTETIQSGLADTFTSFLSGFSGGIDRLRGLSTTGIAPLPFSGAHAEGGITTRASLGIIGESGPEAIIPLSRLGEMTGGDTYIDITVEGSVTSERSLIEAVRQGLLRSQKSGKAIVL